MNLKNAEGYLDPTAAIALANVARSVKAVKAYRPLVYIASQFAGDTEYHVDRARGYCRFAVSRGCIPVAPHLLYPQFMDDSDRDERELGLFFALVLLDKCDELWVFGSTISAGMAAEIRRAKRKNCRLRYFSDECEEVQDA